MEKRIWSKPEMHEFAFAANEYVATSCGDNGKKYLFNCNAPAGALYWFGTKVFGNLFNPLKVNSSEKPNFEDYKTQKLANYYHPCPEKHETETISDFYWGFVDQNKNGTYDYSENEEDDETVIVWRNWDVDEWGIPFKNSHATKELDMSTWELAKS